MSSVIAEMLVKIGADTSALQAGMRQAQQSIEGIKSAFGALGAVVSVGALVSFSKAALDIADKADEMSQKLGMSVEELSRLSFAFKTNGVEADSFQQAMVKLSKGALENEGAFKALGIAVKNTDGTYRSSRQILGDVANFFAKLPDGITKTALATELFGRAGANMIPTLNGGSEALQSAGDQAERFGAVIGDDAAKAAAEFNDQLDLLKMKSQATTVNGLAPVLPVLGEIVKQFMLIGEATKGSADQLGPWQSAFMTAAEAIGVLLLNVVYVARAIGGEVATIAKQLAALAKLDFKEFERLGQEWTQESAAMRKEVDAQSEAILNARNKLKDHADATAQSSAETQRLNGATAEAAQKQAEAALKAKELAEEQKKAAAEIKKAQEAGQAYVDQINVQLGVMNQQISLGRELTDGEKEQNKLTELLRSGKIRLTEAQEAEARGKIDLIQKMKEEDAAKKDLEKTYAAVAAATTKYQNAQMAETEQMRQSLVTLREQNDTLGMSERELVAREKAVLLNRAADLEWQAANEGGNFALEEQVRILRERATELDRGVALREAKAAREEWQKTTDSINNGLTDALMRAFESGKGFMQAFKDTLVNAFKTMVLQPTIKMILAPVSGALGSLFSGSAAAGTGGAGGIGGFMSSLTSLFNGTTINSVLGNAGAFGADAIGNWLVNNTTGSLNSLGGSLMSNAGMLGNLAGMAGNAFAGYGIGSMLNKGISGGYQISGGMSAFQDIGSAVASAFMGPVGGAIVGAVSGLVNRAFGMKAKEMKDYGLEGTITGGDATGQRYQDWFQKGGWFRSDKSGTNYSDLGDDLAAALDFGAKKVLEQTKVWADVLNLPAQQLADVTANFKTKLTDNEKENQAAIELIFTGYQAALTDRFAEVLKPFQKAGETLAQTMERLSALQVASEALNQFGGIFSRLANASIDARENVIALAGGIDQLMAKAGRFVADYYTEAEQAGLQARATLETLSKLGISANDIGGREDFRRLVESIDVSTKQGQEQLVALLDLAPQFASLADYIKEQDTTLSEVAKQAPVVDILNEMLPEAQSTTDAVVDVGDRIKQGNEILEQIVAAVQAGNANIAAGIAAMATAQQAVANAQAEANRIAANTNKAMNDIANNASLVDSQPSYQYDIGQSSFDISP